MDHSSSSQRRRRTSPPDYLSRRMQLQLLLLVSLLMLVLIGVFEAAKPSNWQWLWGAAQPSAVEDVHPAPEEDQPLQIQGVAGRQRAVVVPADLSLGTPAEQGEQRPHGDLPPTSDQYQLWRWTFDQLNPREQGQLTALLFAARHQQLADSELQQQWTSLLEQLDEQVASRVSMLRVELAERGPQPDMLATLEKLKQLEDHWFDQLRPGLAATAGGEPATDAQARVLDQWQLTLDRLLLSTIRDNTPFRPAEAPAWFRMLEVLDGTGSELLAQASLGRISHLQLQEQPDSYRGRLVTVQGTARLGYHVQAPANGHGVGGYYVLWVQPQGAPHELLPVYALSLPAGFPTVTDKDVDRETTRLEEPVTVTGYFFKRWLYPTAEGEMIAPLLLAKSPQWTPAPAATPGTQGLPGGAWIGGGLVACMALAVIVCLVVYRQTLPAAPRQESSVIIRLPPDPATDDAAPVEDRTGRETTQ